MGLEGAAVWSWGRQMSLWEALAWEIKVSLEEKKGWEEKRATD